MFFFVTFDTMFKLKPTGTYPPRFYGLPKIHKDGIPVRPIVSNTGTPLYEISKYIANILKPYGKLKEHTHSSKSFSTFICQQKIEPDKIVVSFDVTSLYTTIFIDQALLIIRDLPEHDDKLADRTLLSHTHKKKQAFRQHVVDSQKSYALILRLFRLPITPG